MKIIFPFLVLLSCITSTFAQQDTTVTTPLSEVNSTKPSRVVFSSVEQMPMFKSAKCDALDDFRAQKVCAEYGMMKAIYKNLQYPEDARKVDAQGTVVISFVVTETGEMEDIKVVKNPNEALSQEAMRVVALLSFHPGKQRGQPVAVRMNVPIRFRLK